MVAFWGIRLTVELVHRTHEQANEDGAEEEEE